ncbi:MAG: molybdopterin-dependent oxidoreductase [Deltaproteobacteria bacterium]|nr:molybdopterin-dependent oxidoreductase [Deltaproteobacteria bacterium]
MSSLNITRRQFLRGSGAAAFTLSLGRLSFAAAAGAAGGGLPPVPSYRTWEDVLRRKWTWDKIAKGTHYVNCWYQRGCNWNVFVKDGLVLREEQVASYTPTNSAVPDFNPRGCQKGACYSQRMYDPDRLKYPLKRAGARGEGKWQRVSWDEALKDIAGTMLDVIKEQGPGAIYWDLGTAATNGCHGIGLVRTSFLLDTPFLDMNAEIGDHHPGAAATCGKIGFASSADDWFYSDVILLWGGNPLYTQIPNAHFFNEARYRGARVISIAPDYNPSSIHADLWLPVNIGSDAALGLSMAHVIIEEKLYDAAFVAEQTDLPLLVRKDTRRFLRESDLEPGGADDVFFFYDLTSKSVQPSSKTTLALEPVRPALEGEFKVHTTAGEATVTPVFSRLREHVKQYAPEAAERITGVRPDLLRRAAREIAKAKAATILTQSNFSKFYHGLEMERVQFLVLALCGHFGKKGSGMNAFPWLTIDSAEAMGVAPALPLQIGMVALAAENAPKYLKAKWDGATDEMFLYEEARAMYTQGGFVSSVLFFYLHGGLKELYGHTRAWDPHLKREIDSYVREAIDKGWQIAPKTPPKIVFEEGGNIFRRVRGYPQLLKHLLPKLKLMVTMDWRMSSTGLQSDYVLPASGYYEKDDLTWATPISPFAHPTTKAVDPLGECKDEWEWHCLLMKTLQEQAVARGQTTFRDRAGKERQLDGIYDTFTFGQRYTEHDADKFMNDMVGLASNLKGTNWEQLKEKGYARYTGIGMGMLNIGIAADIKPDETITANTWHTEQKMVWPTMTRRMQFYIDHELYFELGEELPVHKDNPPIGGNYPLQMTGGHTRWSIHTMWRSDKRMLRLQRGEPVMYMSSKDADGRGIKDGERVRARNDIGAFEIQAKVSPAVRPGQVIVYHAWEPFMFAGHKSHQVAIPSPINPIQLAGGYFHLRPMPIANEPGQNDRGTRLEVEKIGA